MQLIWSYHYRQGAFPINSNAKL